LEANAETNIRSSSRPCLAEGANRFLNRILERVRAQHARDVGRPLGQFNLVFLSTPCLVRDSFYVRSISCGMLRTLDRTAPVNIVPLNCGFGRF
jgi:hypothetical protein